MTELVLIAERLGMLAWPASTNELGPQEATPPRNQEPRVGDWLENSSKGKPSKVACKLGFGGAAIEQAEPGS